MSSGPQVRGYVTYSCGGPRPWKATYFAKGSNKPVSLGQFAMEGDARKAVQMSAGHRVMLDWTQDTGNAQIPSWVAKDRVPVVL